MITRLLVSLDIYKKKSEMKKFNDFVNEGTKMAAPFYEGAAKIKAIVSSEKLASFMGMQSPDIIEQKSDLVYTVKGNAPASKNKIYKVKLKRVSEASYEVSSVETTVALP